jgi:hypothetical protein
MIVHRLAQYMHWFGLRVKAGKQDRFNNPLGTRGSGGHTCVSNSTQGDPMGPFAVVILICSANLGHSDCQPNTALDVIRGPNVANELMCGLMGQTTIAATAISPRESREYLKILCLKSPKARSTAALERPTELDQQE